MTERADRSYSQALSNEEGLKGPDTLEANDDIVIVDRSKFSLLAETFGNLIRPFSRRIALPASALLLTIAAAAIPTREVASTVSAKDNAPTHIERMVSNPFVGDQEITGIRDSIVQLNLPEATGGSVEAETAEKPRVRAVYLVPADRDINPAYALGIERAMQDIQEWYSHKLGANESFQIGDPVVEIVQTSHNADWYSMNPANSNPLTQFINNVSTDAATAIPDFFEGDNWVIVVDADSSSEQLGAAATLDVAAILDGDYLRGLAGEFSIDEGFAPNTVLSNVGVVAHEIGHTFGFQHPDPICGPGPNPEDCNLLMSLPFTYPLVDLTPGEITMLSDSPFFHFPYTESEPDFQVEVRMFNVRSGAVSQEQFSLNGFTFMQIVYPVDTGKIDISNWVESGPNSIGLEAFGLHFAHTYGFEIYIEDLLVFERSCGEPDVLDCENGVGPGFKVFTEIFTFDAPTPSITPTPVVTSTSTEVPVPSITPTSSPTDLLENPVGDVNCDYLANSIDAVLVLQKVAGLISNLECEDNGDTNFDGTLSSVDSALILQFDAGIIDGFNQPAD